MKAVYSILFVATILSSCKKENSVSESKENAKFTVDSVVVNDSLKVGTILQLNYENRILVFPDITEKPLQDSIYSFYKDLKSFSKQGISEYIENDKKSFYADIQKENMDWLKDEKYEDFWYQTKTMRIVSKTNDFMHIQYFGRGYLGGAHDNYYFRDRVFDLKNRKRLNLSDITTMESAKISELLLKNINNYKSNASQEMGAVDNSEMLLVEQIPVTENFYFDAKNLYFHFSPYEITAFAAGDVIIPISWEELKGTLVSDFKERAKL